MAHHCLKTQKNKQQHQQRKLDQKQKGTLIPNSPDVQLRGSGFEALGTRQSLPVLSLSLNSQPGSLSPTCCHQHSEEQHS